MESVLASAKLNSALIFHDPRSTVFGRIIESGDFGMLDSGIDAKVHIMAASVGLTDDRDQALRHRPVVISPMDIG